MNKEFVKKRVLPFMATILILGAILLAGPASAFSVSDWIANPDNPNVGSTVVIFVEIVKNVNEVIDTIDLGIEDPNGNPVDTKFLNCTPKGSTTGDGYGYGYSSGYGYGYGFPGYSSGYGYGYSSGYGYGYGFGVVEQTLKCKFQVTPGVAGIHSGTLLINNIEIDTNPELFTATLPGSSPPTTSPQTLGGSGGTGGGGNPNPSTSALLRLSDTEIVLGNIVTASAKCNWEFGCKLYADGILIAELTQSLGFKDFDVKFDESGDKLFELYQNGTQDTLVATRIVTVTVTSDQGTQDNSGSQGGTSGTTGNNGDQGTGGDQGNGGTSGDTGTTPPSGFAVLGDIDINSLGPGIIILIIIILGIAFFYYRRK